MFSIALLNTQDLFQSRVKGDLQRICEKALVVQGPPQELSEIHILLVLAAAHSSAG
jgi:hypothetical protein